jgi:hypothetical protein
VDWKRLDATSNLLTAGPAVRDTYGRGVTDDAEAWIPFMMSGTAQDFAERGSRGFAALARLKVGVSRTQAQSELDVISKGLERAHPDTNEGRAVEVAALDQELFGDIRQPLLVLLCAVYYRNPHTAVSGRAAPPVRG